MAVVNQVELKPPPFTGDPSLISDESPGKAPSKRSWLVWHPDGYYEIVAIHDKTTFIESSNGCISAEILDHGSGLEILSGTQKICLSYDIIDYLTTHWHLTSRVMRDRKEKRYFELKV